MATNAKSPAPPASNGVITAPATAGSNRKKAKRRAKQAAKAAAQGPVRTPSGSAPAGVYEEDPLGYGEEEEDYEFSDAELDHHYSSNHAQNGVRTEPATSKKKNKKKKGGATGQRNAYNPDTLPNAPNAPPPPLRLSVQLIRAVTAMIPSGTPAPPRSVKTSRNFGSASARKSASPC